MWKVPLSNRNKSKLFNFADFTFFLMYVSSSSMVIVVCFPRNLLSFNCLTSLLHSPFSRLLWGFICFPFLFSFLFLRFPLWILPQVEDPFLFASRVGWAHEKRREAEAMLRYALYIDCMPIDEIRQLDNEQINRILAISLNTKDLRNRALDTGPLLNEINVDYARTINRIIFDLMLNDPTQTDLRKQVALSPMPKPKLGSFVSFSSIILFTFSSSLFFLNV